jgi:probable phosphoglycerate mutase
MSTIFYIARHGQSEGNVAGDIMGGDPPLTELGLEQASALANLFKSTKINRVFASNLIRARQTAQAIADQQGLELEIDSRLKERSFGSLEGQTANYFSTNFQAEIDQFRNGSLTYQMAWKVVEDMESFSQLLDRVLPFFNDFDGNSQEENILLVTHANVILALLGHLAFLNSYRELPYGSIQNTSYLKIRKQAQNFEIIETLGISKKK